MSREILAYYEIRKSYTGKNKIFDRPIFEKEPLSLSLFLFLSLSMSHRVSHSFTYEFVHPKKCEFLRVPRHLRHKISPCRCLRSLFISNTHFI